MADLIPPTVNLNGESLDALLVKHVDAYHALDKAVVLMRQCYPHGRDYPQGMERAYAARDAFSERLRALEIMAREIEAVALDINRQRRM